MKQLIKKFREQLQKLCERGISALRKWAAPAAAAAVPIALLCFAPPAKAFDVYQPTKLFSATNLPSTVATATLTNCTSYIATRQGYGLALQWKFNVSSGTSNAVYLFYPTVDGTNYWTVPWQKISTATSTTDVIDGTNWSAAQLQGIRGFRIGLTNQNAGTFTNKGLTASTPNP